MEEILRRIPHRAPFLFIDRIIEINSDNATCELNVREDLDIFKGHYPNNPILPGVLSCEAIFQAGAIFLSEKIGEEALNASSVTPVLSRIRDARFKRMIKPGDTVEIKVFLLDQAGKFYNLRGEIRLKGKVVTTVSFALALVEAKQDG